MENKELERAKKARNEYYKNYRKNNKEKIKLYNQAYWINRSKKYDDKGQYFEN